MCTLHQQGDLCWMHLSTPDTLPTHGGEKGLLSCLISGSEAAYKDPVVRGSERGKGRMANCQALQMPALQTVKSNNTLCAYSAEAAPRDEWIVKNLNLALKEVLRTRVEHGPHTKCKYKGRCKEAFPEDRAANCGNMRERVIHPTWWLRSFMIEVAVALIAQIGQWQFGLWICCEYKYKMLCVFLWVQIHLCMCIYMCVETRGQCQVLFLRQYVFLRTGSFTGLKLAQ